MASGRRSTLRQRLFAILVAGIGAATASAVSFAMAVYEAANPEPLPRVAAGEAIDTGRWIVTVREARFGRTPPPRGTASPDPGQFLTVEFDLDNRSAASAYASTNLFAIEPPVPGLPAPTIYLARDSNIASPLNPGMPERLVAAWEWPADQPAPADALRLVIGGQIYKRRDNLYGASSWFDRDPVAVVELPVSPPDTEEAR